MAHSFTNILVHIVFGTKGREPWLSPNIIKSLLPFLGGGVKVQQAIPLEINAVSDHVHMLVKIRPDRSISDLLRDVKARSSGWIHRHYPELQHFAWQTGYGAFSVGMSQIDQVRAYIRNQEKHHESKLFADEFVEFLVASGVEFDEQHLWD